MNRGVTFFVTQNFSELALDTFGGEPVNTDKSEYRISKRLGVRQKEVGPITKHYSVRGHSA